MSSLAITDANIFIDLFRMELPHLLFEAGLEIHTTREVVDELYPEQQAVLLRFSGLHIHDISDEQWTKIQQLNLPRKFSQADCSVMGLAYQLQVAVLSNEKLMRKKAAHWGLEVRGTLWLLDQFVQLQCCSPVLAAERLERLMRLNPYLPKAEGMARLNKWASFAE
jgi:predicted nucleic acid-binding protein